MKAFIKSVKFKEEREGKYGMEYNFIVTYVVDAVEKSAYYTGKVKDQKKFIEGQECEFTEEQKTSKSNTPYWVVKPIQQGGYNQSGFGKALKKEQSKYSGFAMSYAKDLVVANKIELAQMSEYTRKMFTLMVELDKTLEA